MSDPRTYERHEKHKAPKGWGAICQSSVSLDHAKSLLLEAIGIPGVENPKLLYAVCGEAVFEARPTRFEANVWHGYPVPGCQVPPKVIREFEVRGIVDHRTAQRLLKQSALPETCACS